MRTAFLLGAACLLAAPTSAAVERSSVQIEAVEAFGIVANFAEAEAGTFTGAEQAMISDILQDAYARTVQHYPDLGAVEVDVEVIDRPGVDALGGVTGRAQSPGRIVIQVSATYPDGMAAAIEANLARTILHELHHLARGWTINGNAFGPGIHIAAVNEGLAVVYSEEMTGQADASGRVPDDPQAWALEIRDLPLDATYWEWMFVHPDGRQAVGYRTGTWLVRQAMANSGLGFFELAERSPDEIWQLAGFDPRAD